MTEAKTISEAAEKIIKKATRKNKPILTDANRLKLLDAGQDIFMNPANEKDAAYMCRALVQATLPHKAPKSETVYVRKNGSLTMVIQSGYDSKESKHTGIPYGTKARLLLFFITSEAVRLKNRNIKLGNNLADFMHQLGLNPDNGTGKRSDAKQLKEQMSRLFKAQITFEYSYLKGDRLTEVERDMKITDSREIWWNAKDPNQSTIWESWIELGEKFFHSITAAPVPIDMRALKALKGSALALDLYALLSYEAYKVSKSSKTRSITWKDLHSQLGADYKEHRFFAVAARQAIKKIKTVYPALQLGDLKGGLSIKPDALPAITPRENVTIEGKAEKVKEE